FSASRALRMCETATAVSSARARAQDAWRDFSVALWDPVSDRWLGYVRAHEPGGEGEDGARGMDARERARADRARRMCRDHRVRRSRAAPCAADHLAWEPVPPGECLIHDAIVRLEAPDASSVHLTGNWRASLLEGGPRSGSGRPGASPSSERITRPAMASCATASPASCAACAFRSRTAEERSRESVSRD